MSELEKGCKNPRLAEGVCAVGDLSNVEEQMLMRLDEIGERQ